MTRPAPRNGEWIPVGLLSDIPTKIGRCIPLPEIDEEIALFRDGKQVFAIDNVCPHQHSPVLSESPRMGEWISCPMHGWTYSLRTGMMQGGGGGVRTYRTRVDGDHVFVEKPKAREPRW